MPIPTPKTGETKKQFIGRCMGNSKMLTEYPDNAQRYAVCLYAHDHPKRVEGIKLKKGSKHKEHGEHGEHGEQGEEH